MNEFGKRLRKLRHRSRWTQQEIADRLGVSKSSISMYENGKREPDFELMGSIADLFQVDMDYLYGKSGIPNRDEATGWNDSVAPYGRHIIYQDEWFEVTATHRTLKADADEALRNELLRWTQEES